VLVVLFTALVITCVWFFVTHVRAAESDRKRWQYLRRLRPIGAAKAGELCVVSGTVWALESEQRSEHFNTRVVWSVLQKNDRGDITNLTTAPEQATFVLRDEDGNSIRVHTGNAKLDAIAPISARTETIPEAYAGAFGEADPEWPPRLDERALRIGSHLTLVGRREAAEPGPAHAEATGTQGTYRTQASRPETLALTMLPDGLYDEDLAIIEHAARPSFPDLDLEDLGEIVGVFFTSVTVLAGVTAIGGALFSFLRDALSR